MNIKEQQELQEIIKEFHLLMKFILSLIPILGIFIILKYINEVYFKNLLTFVLLTTFHFLSISAILQYLILKL